ncbi:MAG: exodeoxyribonuclease large subunit [Alphaproteobacteria bacterium]|jgi:exodeoxyribonuclease VII large subunit|nr:exodeoxyribonuclease large subunit [Alphaproteobacteria bacterium]
MNEPRLNIVEWTVSALSTALRKTVEDAYGYVRVRGEISGFKGPSPSGHVYLRLKDDKAVLEAVIWKTTFGRLRMPPQEGLEVIVTGRLTTFAGSSKYQIVIETLEPAGLGALMALLEQRKKTLAAEGLFDAARKQLLPYLPDVIGVVTSPTGAVIRDILHRLADRFPRHVIVWPVRVQGEGSAAEVAAAIAGFNALPPLGLIRKPDLLIIARGGGSLEDLWSFNEEIVVRAAAESMIPLMSAVGHETDVTLIDFAADRRAPTPTAAAEMAVPVRAELLIAVDSLARRTLACWQRCQEARRSELRAAARALPGAEELFALPRQRLDHAAARLPRALIANAQLHHTAYHRIAGRLTPQALRMRIARECTQTAALAQRAGQCLRVHVERRRDRFDALSQRLDLARAAYASARRTQIGRGRERVLAFHNRTRLAFDALFNGKVARLERAERLLVAVSYRGVLARGFALVRDLEGTPLRTAGSIRAAQPLQIEFSDGRVRARAERDGASAATPPSLPKPRRRGGGSAEGQGNLFGS